MGGSSIANAATAFGPPASRKFRNRSTQNNGISSPTHCNHIYLSPASFFCASSHVSPKTPRHMHHAPDRCNQVPNLRRRHTMKIKSDHRRTTTQTKPRTTLPPSPLPLMIHHRRAIICHDRLGAHAQQQTKVQTSPRHPSRWSSAVHPTSCCEAGTDGFVFLENLFTRLVQSQKKALAVTLSSFLSRVGFYWFGQSREM